MRRGTLVRANTRGRGCLIDNARGLRIRSRRSHRCIGVPHAPFLLALPSRRLALAQPASAQSVEEFYKGKTVNLVIGFSVGGGYDLYARHLARHIGKHIPGQPDRSCRRTCRAPAR